MTVKRTDAEEFLHPGVGAVDGVQGLPATQAVTQGLSNRLHSSRDLPVGYYAAMLDALGYELKVVPKADDRPEYTIGESGDGRELLN